MPAFFKPCIRQRSGNPAARAQLAKSLPSPTFERGWPAAVVRNRRLVFLAQVMDGGPVTQGDGETIMPTVDQRVRAATVLANKLVPDARENPVSFSLGALNGPETVLRAMAAVARRMAAGELTPSGAGAAVAVIGQYAKAYELTELERRISELEARR
jgi:hypothetical protein